LISSSGQTLDRPTDSAYDAAYDAVENRPERSDAGTI
jgi:hypothetical protein